MAMSEDEFCERCGRKLPPLESNSYPSEVEAVAHEDGSVGVICSGCLTEGEEQEMDQDAMDWASFLSVCSRCGSPRPEREWEESGWRLIGDGDAMRLLCPGCATPEDIAEHIKALRDAVDRLSSQGGDE
jgi:hypothetical protein